MEQKTMYTYLVGYAAAMPDSKLLGDNRGWLTAEEALANVNTAAEKLTGLGITSGCAVALRMSQNKESVIWLLALQAIGAAAVLTDWHSGIRDALKDADLPEEPEWLISDESGEWAVEHGGRQNLLNDCVGAPFVPASAPDAPGFVIFTSGSTGKQKGVILSQNNLLSNLLDSAPLGGYRADDIALGALPLCHVFGLALLTGAVVLRHSLYILPGNDLEGLLQTVQTQRITRMNGVPGLYLNMAAQRERFDLSSLRTGFIGGAPCTAAQFERIERELEMTLIPVYGMSECVGIACASYRDPQKERIQGVGRFYSMNEGKILLPDGETARTGEVGEICVRGAMRFLGYCREEQTAENVDRDGFLHTGDLGYLDEQGILHLTGRKKDILIRNGVNLSVRRIEEAILGIPDVEEAAVVGIEHPVQGEVPCAMAVTCRSELELLAILTERLNKNELPVGIRIVDRLPRTISGKPDKNEIREVLQQWAKV